ncbi:MAG: hypothetical protein V1813_02140 [Candidatus Aenigmatarchaeota archaeon]
MLFPRCSDCGAISTTVRCLRMRKDLCRSCCDMDCKSQYSCWGRYL